MKRPGIVLPGIYGSDERHWQTLWQVEDPSLRRFAPASWDEPDLADWEVALDDAVGVCSQPPVLIAHSLATLLVAHWLSQDPSRRHDVAGAFLVSVPDPTSPVFPQAAHSFREPTRAPMPVPSLVVTSSSDPFGSTEYQADVARRWHSGWVCVGDHGHLNSASGLGPWKVGRDLYTAFTSALACL